MTTNNNNNKSSNCKVYWYAFDGASSYAKIPTQEPGSVGYDIYAIPEGDGVTIVLPAHGGKHVFHTGLKCIVPDDYWLRFRERSSTGNLQMTLHAGVIDSSYRGELKVIIANYSEYTRFFTPDGEKYVDEKLHRIYYPLTKAIAQASLRPKIPTEDIVVKSAADWDKLCHQYASSRGEGGFGSSGK